MPMPEPVSPPRRHRRCLSLPADVLDELERLSEATGIPQSRIAEQGIRARLAELGPALVAFLAREVAKAPAA